MPRLENARAYRKASQREILDKAREVVEKEVERCSDVFSAEAEQAVPVFALSELQTGRVVGRGGFCAVKEINAITLGKDDKSGGRVRQNSASRAMQTLKRGFSSSSTAKEEEGSTREQLARRVWKGVGKYVIKQVEPMLLEEDRVTFLKGVIDLALETKYLASLSHRHILKLRGMSSTSPFEDVNYFIVLDRLEETMAKRLTGWMHKKRATTGITGAFTGGKRKQAGLLVERLLVVYDIAEGMDYLHSNRIIFRDLKPDNIGFDSEGCLKIFDFGLAKELQEDEKTKDGLYKMTGFTGALRAPEVGLKKPYNLKADVYSWSMIMWYTMALEPPMGLYTPNMFIDRVFKKGARPAVKDKWPQGLQTLMRKAWSQNIQARPEFKEITKALKAEVDLVDPKVGSFMGAASSMNGSRRSKPPEPSEN